MRSGTVTFCSSIHPRTFWNQDPLSYHFAHIDLGFSRIDTRIRYRWGQSPLWAGFPTPLKTERVILIPRLQIKRGRSLAERTLDARNREIH